MKKHGKKFAGVCIACAGILELISGVYEGVISTVLIGIGFFIIGSLYFLENRKNS